MASKKTKRTKAKQPAQRLRGVVILASVFHVLLCRDVGKAGIGLLAVTCLLTAGQRVVVGGFDVTAIRILIVAGWARRFDARRARELGFRAEGSFEEIVRIHIEDELGGRFVV